jgi:hypothetical protein
MNYDINSCPKRLDLEIRFFSKIGFLKLRVFRVLHSLEYNALALDALWSSTRFGVQHFSFGRSSAAPAQLFIKLLKYKYFYLKT